MFLQSALVGARRSGDMSAEDSMEVTLISEPQIMSGFRNGQTFAELSAGLSYAGVLPPCQWWKSGGTPYCTDQLILRHADRFC